MTRIVAVHGIGQQVLGPEVLVAQWLPALRDGLGFAGVPENQRPAKLEIAFYGNVFRGKSGASTAATRIRLAPGFEKELLKLVYARAAELGATPTPEMLMNAKSVDFVTAEMLKAIIGLPFFTGIPAWDVAHNLKQVHRYLHQAGIRRDAQAAVAPTLQAGARVVIGHSLGSVVAYEALAAHPEWSVDTFITLGSPLGLPLFIERLNPPARFGKGVWPGSVKRWLNIVGKGDLVALEPNLRYHYAKSATGDPIDDVVIDNDVHAHDATAYLTSRVTGAVVARALGLMP